MRRTKMKKIVTDKMSIQNFFFFNPFYIWLICLHLFTFPYGVRISRPTKTWGNREETTFIFQIQHDLARGGEEEDVGVQGERGADPLHLLVERWQPGSSFCHHPPRYYHYSYEHPGGGLWSNNGDRHCGLVGLQVKSIILNWLKCES